MLDPALLLRLTREVTKANNILVASHANCGDATGAVTACRMILGALGKSVTMFLPEPVAASYKFLSETENVISKLEFIDLSRFDLVLSVDAAEAKLTGLADLLKDKPPSLQIINFDHHHTNTGFGDLNIVDRQAAATCAMLYEWFRFAGWFIDHRAATSLLTGILTDTGTFSNPATNDTALKAAADLLARGANVSRVLTHVAGNRTLTELKLWGRVFERLRDYPDLGLVVAVITQADLKEFAATDEMLEGVANFLNSLEGYRAVLVLKEKSDGTVKGSLRTTRDDVDVAAIAKLFGGGGHRKAAGFTLPGRLVETEQGWRVEKVQTPVQS
jgi:phosphoesterase RecJ-like protein